MKIFGREPALAIGVLTSLIMIAGTLGFSLLSQDQAVLWVAVINALAAAAVAFTTRPVVVGPISIAIATLIALGAAYGFNVPDATVQMINAAVVPLLLFLTRDQVSPVETAVSNA